MNWEKTDHKFEIKYRNQALSTIRLQRPVSVAKVKWFNPDEAMKTGIFTSGTSGSGKTVLNFHFADMLMKAGVQVYVVDPSQAWESGSSVPNVLHITRSTKIVWENGTAAQSTIFDVSRLTYPERIEFANKLCKIILDNRKNNPDRRHPTFIFFEEGQLYFPQRSMMLSRKRAQKNEWEGQAVEVVTNGRNYNIRFGVITQFPSMIDKLLVKMCKQRYFGWTNEPNDVDYIDDIIGKEMGRKLEKLEVGEFVYSYPVRGEGTRQIKVPMFSPARKPKDIVIHQKQGQEAEAGSEKGPKAEKALSDLAAASLACSVVLAFIIGLLWVLWR